MDWRSFGGNKNYEKNNNVNFNNLTTDNLILKNPYNGLFTISGELLVKSSTIFYSNLDISNNVTIGGKTDISGDLNIGGNAIFYKDLTIKGAINLENDVTIGNSLYVNKNVFVRDSLYVDGSNVYIGNSNVILTANNRNLGVNVSNPTASIDVSGNTINTLKMTSSKTENVNIISIDCSNDGITVLTDGTKNAIQFWNNTKIPINVGGVLDNANILLNTREDASITYYPEGGNITIDCLNNTYINSNITIGGGASGTDTLPHLLNETALIKSSDFSKYLSNYYGVSSSSYQTGNALTLVSGSSLPSNVGLSLVTTNGKGMTVNGGVYIKDSTRSVGTTSIFDVCGATFPVQTAVSGNDPRYLKATTGFNTLAPQTENYTMCVNGPIKITNDEIQTLIDVSFQVNCVVNSLASPSNIIVAGSANDINGNHPIIYSNNGGKSWLNAIYNFSLSDSSFLFKNGFVYDLSYSFLTGSNSFVIFSSDGNASWNKISNGLLSNYTDVLVLPQSINNDNLVLISGFSGFSGIYWFIVDSLNDMNNIENPNTGYEPEKSDIIIDTPNPVYCMGAISAVNELGILYVAGSGIKSYTINDNIDYTEFVTPTGTNPINTGHNTDLFFPVYGRREYSSDKTYFTMDITRNFAVFAGINIITYTSNPYTSGEDTESNAYIYGSDFNNYIAFVDVIRKIKISSNGGVIAVGDAGAIYYSMDKCVSWSTIIPNNYGMGGILTNPVNMLTSVAMPDANSFLISSVDISYSSTNYGHSKLFYCHWPNLFNHANNNVLDICGNMNITGSALINDGVKINKRLDVVGDVSMNSNFTINNDATIRGNVTILQDQSIIGTLTVQGKSYINEITEYRNTTEATSTTSASVVYSGGIGIAGNLFMGGNLNVANISYLTNTTLSSNSVTGALVVTGGVGVGKSINIGTNADVSGDLTIKGRSFFGDLNNPTNSTSLTTGAVVVKGGMGVAGNVNIGGNSDVSGVLTINGNVNAINATSGGTLTVRGGLGVSKNTYIGGDLAITSMTESTDYNSGSLRVLGGVGVSQNIYTGGIIGINSSEESYSEVTGALRVKGGIGVGCNIYSGKGVFIKGEDADNSASLGIPGAVGALQVINGGAWIKGNIVTKSNVLVNNNVGIRTTNPTYPLDVSGDVMIQSTNSLFLNNSRNSIYGDVSNIYYNVSGGTVSHKFNVTNKTLATINSIGVGIRTTAPRWDLDVSGNGRVTGNLYLDTSSNNYIYSDFSNVYFNVSGGTHKFNVGGVAGGGTVATINRVGLGIGITTPGCELDVSGAGRFSNGLVISEKIGSTPSNMGAPNGGIGALVIKHGNTNGSSCITFPSNYYGTDGDVTDYGYIQYIDNYVDSPIGSTGNSESAKLIIGIENNSDYKVNSDDIVLWSCNGNGKIGVNTKSPSYNLDVSGNGRFSDHLTLKKSICMDGSSNNLDSSIYFLADSGSNPNPQLSNNTVGRIFGTCEIGMFYDYFKSLQFRYRSSLSGGASGPTITFVDGKIGIGNTPSIYNFDVSGTGRFTNGLDICGNAKIEQNICINAGLSSNNLYFLSDKSGTPSTSTNNGNIVSRIFTTGSNLYFDYYTNITFRYASELYNNTRYTGSQIFFTNVNSSASIGIGVNNPSYNLDVSGAGRFTGVLYLNNSTLENLNQIQFKNATNTYTIQQIDQGNQNYFRMGRNGSGDIIINSDGKVGIGISPSYKLDVDGTGRFNNSITIDGNSSNFFYCGPTNYISSDGSTTTYVSTNNAHIFTSYNKGVGSGSGSVSIGGKHPDYNLDVSGTGRFTNSVIIEKNVTSNSLNDTILLTINNNNNSTIPVYENRYSSIALTSQGVGAIIRGVHKSNAGGGLSIRLTYPEIEVISINHGGNVGINNGDPSYALDVSGDIQIRTSGNFRMPNTGQIYAKNSTGTYLPIFIPCWSDNITYLNYGSDGMNIRNNSIVSTMFLNSSNQVGIGTTTPSYKLDVNGTGRFNGTLTASSNIHVSGNIGIGTASPSYNLDVNGTGRFTGIITLPEYRCTIDASSSGIFFTSASNYSWRYNNLAGANVELMTLNSGGALNVTSSVTATSFYATSDYRIKENIVNLKETNYTVDNLRPVHYYNKNTNKEDIGFVAHEVQENFPFLVSGEKDGKENQTLNYTGLIGVLVKEIQYLKSEKAKQDVLIQTLTDNNTKQDVLIQTLLQRINAFEITQQFIIIIVMCLPLIWVIQLFCY